jgi:hypothetical protein
MATMVPAPHEHRRVAAATLGSLRAVAAGAARVQSWAATAEARHRTERALLSIARAGWDIAHDVQLPGVDRLDHLAVGPSGVYLLTSKAWQGMVTVDHKGATITPQHDPGSAWTALGPHRSLPPAASAVVRALAGVTGRPVPAPRAVVVVWAPFPEQVTVCAGVSYVAGEHLADWLVGQPARPEMPPLGRPGGAIGTALPAPRAGRPSGSGSMGDRSAPRPAHALVSHGRVHRPR